MMIMIKAFYYAYFFYSLSENFVFVLVRVTCHILCFFPFEAKENDTHQHTHLVMSLALESIPLPGLRVAQPTLRVETKSKTLQRIRVLLGHY